MKKERELELAFRQHVEEMHGEKMLRRFAGSELEALCITFIQKQGQTHPLGDVRGCFKSEEDLQEFVHSNMPTLIKPVRKSKKKLISPFTSAPAFIICCNHIAEKIWNKL